MRKLFLLAVVCTCWLALTGSATADIIYHVNQIVAGGSVTGTITTDGALGPLFNGDIVDFSLTLNDGTATATLMDGVNGGTVFMGGGSINATATDLTFNFNNPSFFANFFTSPGCQPIWTVRGASGTACNGVGGSPVSSVQATPTTGPATMSQTGTVVIATTTVVPEPGSVGLMVAGLVSLIGLCKRHF